MLWGRWRESLLGVRIRGPEDIGARLAEFLDGLDQEAILGLAVGPDRRVRSCSLVSLGSCWSAHAEPRDLFREAIRVGAASVIVAHNHPSGSTAPSEADLDFTGRLIHSGVILGIEVLDHLVLADSSWRSLRDSTSIWDSILGGWPEAGTD